MSTGTPGPGRNSLSNLRDILLPILSKIETGAKRLEVSELWGASKALFLSSLRSETGRPVIAVVRNDEEAESLAEDLRFFSDRSLVAPETRNDRAEDFIFTLPSWDLLPFEADSPDSRTIGERMRFLYHMISGNPGVYVVPLPSLLQKLPPWDLFVDSVRTIKPGSSWDTDSLAAALTGAGYESASLVTRPGEFSRRGGIVDFFSPLHDHPMRAEFFGDTIESLRGFEPESQRSTHPVSEAVILPVRELIVTPAGIDAFCRAMEGHSLVDEIREGIMPPGVEFLAPFFYPMETLFRYAPRDSLFCLTEPDDIDREAVEQKRRQESGRAEEAEEGRLLPDAEQLFLSKAEINQELSRFPVLTLPLLGSEPEYRMDAKSAAWLGVRLTPIADRGGQGPDRSPSGIEGGMAQVVEKLKHHREFSRIAVVCGTPDSAARLKNLFLEHGLGAAVGIPVLNQDRANPVAIRVGRLSRGFAWLEAGLIFIAEEEIFGAKVHAPRPRTRQSKAAPFLSTFRELKPGDFVVHADYGVGEYQGLTHISVDGFETDFLTLRYQPDVKLYVPLYSLDKVQKYIGVEGSAPKLDRLGAPTWARTKEKAKKDILAMARELVQIYAAREAHHRPPFSAPDNLYREFEAAFPFDETPDQQRAIEDVLEDMQRPRPMDRVVCGDVGYGKTEVALRAAFKAVEDGLQAAVLVPTTLLADQHFRTFSERLAPFSVRVEMLSRFRTRAEQQETLRGLKSGIVDIVIGTHRLIQKDVSFRNLGLLIVDEEHKFGVRHKERIKEFKKLVDVLTLTATPIPRTLHMSFAGIRDLSIIQTPPLDRQAIHVSLARFGKRVIREAIIREIERGGRVFFLQNRVQGIERMADFIRNLVPEARVGIGHGQLKEDEIEDVMKKFIAGELNVLVTTTIIESGIDIPAANTIIINRADRFGLADLYQIKGRVGRSREKAYAVLLAPADEALTETARTRLRAIQELSELGAGFRIAAQDLETRGAGNLLGKQQSGHIAAVGIDLYTQMMEEAMGELRGEERAPEPDTQIHMRASAFIPEDYIRDVSLRLAAYKEISSVGDEARLRDLRDELRDRYGPLPEPAVNLFEIMSIKMIARLAGAARVDAGREAVTIAFAEGAKISPDRVMLLLKRNKGKITFIPQYTLRLSLPDESLRTAADAVKKCLQELI